VNSGAEMVGQIAIYRPGDKVKISYRRNGKDFNTDVVLRNSTGTTEVVKTSSLDKLGAQLEALSKKDAAELGIKGGVVVRSLVENGLMERSRVQEGFVILKINGKDVLSVDDVKKALEESGATAKLEGIFPGYEGVYQFPLRLNEGR
jgi:serine protease Do